MTFFSTHARAFRVAALFVLSVLPGLAAAQINEEQKLLASLAGNANSGRSVAISGDTAVVGAPNDNGGNGAAYVFTRSGTTWTYQATLTASDAAAGDAFGTSVALSTAPGTGNIAVGAPGRSSGAGAVYVYTGSGASWTENPNLTRAGNSGNLGASVAIEGFTVAAGAPSASINNKPNVGVVVVFASNNGGNTWVRSTLRPNGGQARNGAVFGTSVALSGNTLAGGAPGYHTGNKANSGTAFVFVNNGSGWTQQANLRPSNTANWFAGASVALSGNTIVVGAPGANNQGGAWVYTRVGTTWGGSTALTAIDGANGDQFGASVAVQGGVAVVGAPNASDTAGAASGKAYEFSTLGVQLNRFVATDNAAGDHFGASVGMDGGRAIVGAPFAFAVDEVPNGAAGDGAAYVFQYQTPSVTTITSPLPADPASLVGVPYAVSVHVDHDVGGSGVPTGTVTVTDDQGGTCDAPIILDLNGDGTCNLTSNTVGTLTLTAQYSGDLVFASSQGTVQHEVKGHNLAFNPDPPDSIVQGDQASVVVEVRDENDAVITTDNTTNVTLTVDDTCGNTGIVIGTVQVVAGVATFSNVGPHFYTLDPGTLGLHATSDDGTAPANTNIGVVADSNDPPNLVFADGFEECRL